jgi:hypothetical protein
LKTNASAVPLDRAKDDGMPPSWLTVGPAKARVTSTPCGRSSLRIDEAKEEMKALEAV